MISEAALGSLNSHLTVWNVLCNRYISGDGMQCTGEKKIWSAVITWLGVMNYGMSRSHSTFCVCVQHINKQFILCITNLSDIKYTNLHFFSQQKQPIKICAQLHQTYGDYKLAKIAGRCLSKEMCHNTRWSIIYDIEMYNRGMTSTAKSIAKSQELNMKLSSREEGRWHTRGDGSMTTV